MSQPGLFGKVENTRVQTHVFFDTETTGLPMNWAAPVTDVRNWPRMVQLAWEVYENGQRVDSSNFIIKPDGYQIPADTTAIHGITTERAQKEGVPLQEVLSKFQAIMVRADVVVAHNMSFDEKIIGAEFLRANMENVLASKKTLCTKEITTNFCAIPNSSGRGTFKWPKLSELYQKLFNTEFIDYHNARTDVQATAKCFWELKKRGII